MLAPFLTPALTYLYAHETVTVNMMDMFMSIVKIVIIPIVLGFIINKLFGKFTQAVVEILPLISVVAIVTIVGAVVAPNADKLFANGLLILSVVILHNLLGYALGYAVGKLLHMSGRQVQRPVHRGGHAEQRSGHQPGRHRLPRPGPGHRARCAVQRVA